MDIRPVRQYRGCRIPTADILVEHPELLRLVPRRWRNNPVVLHTMAVSAGLLLTSCQTRTQMDWRDREAMPIVLLESSTVAPVFLHGTGRGRFGSIDMTPPIFLSEEEAQEVIKDEAKKYGIDFQDGPTIVLASQTEDWPESKEDCGETIAFPLDGRDPEKKISYECLPLFRDDAITCLNPSLPWDYGTTAYDADLPRDANVLRNAIIRSGMTDVCGIFYAPFKHLMVPYDYWTAGGSEKNEEFIEKNIPGVKEALRESLRLQVHDFIAWLKGQGII